MSCFCIGIGIALEQALGLYEYEIYLANSTLHSSSQLFTTKTAFNLKHFTELAFIEALADANIGLNQLYEDMRIGVVIGSSLGFIDLLEYAPKKTMDFSWLTQKFKIRGPLYVVSNTCVSSLNAITIARFLLASGKLDYCIVGGIDAVSDFIVSGFRAMNLLSCDHSINLADSIYSGTVLAPAAVFVVLSSKTHINYNLEITSCEVGNEAFDLAAVDKTGTVLQKIINSCISQAKLSFKQLDVLLTCANGTKAINQQQDYIIKQCFSNTPCIISSVKPTVGHTLAASSLLDIASVAMFARNGMVLNAKQQWIPKRICNAMILATGFGGATGALLLHLGE